MTLYRGSFPIDELQEFFIYPDGREGTEIKVHFMMKADMISGSDRDTIHIVISDTEVTVTGTAIEGIEKIFQR